MDSHVRKFHTVKNWYQSITARENLVPIHHIFRTNISHFVKNTHEVKFQTRAAVDGTPSQIPAIYLKPLPWVKVTQNVAQYLLHNETYAPVKFEVAMSNG